MAKKKQPKNFKNNPFSDLKGFSVPKASVEAPKKTTRTQNPAPAEEDFDAAMDSLGVQKLSSSDDRLPRPVPTRTVATAESEPIDTEEEEFLVALGQLDVRFADEYPEEVSGEEPAARRMKQLRRGKLRVEGEVDLHGLTRAEALEKFDFFLADARYQGWQTVRVITGQGHHSADGPVVREAIENLLRTHCPKAVLEWGRAPRLQGGQGALILFLRSPVTPA